MDLNKLSTFVRVVEEGNFTRAAVALGLRKSSVSRSVAQLEHDLDVRLLHRTTRKLKLTDAGRAYFESVREAIAKVMDATATLREAGQEPSGTIRLTAPPGAIESILVDMVTRFVRRYPKIRIELSLTSRTVDLVEEGFDLALRGGKLVDSSLVTRKIQSGELVLIASPAYLRRRGRPKTLAELSLHDCVIYRPKRKNVWQVTGPHGEESVEVNGPIGVDDMTFAARAVAAGAGIGLVPSTLMIESFEVGQLVRVLPEYEQPGAGLYLVAPPSAHERACVRLFADYVVTNVVKRKPVGLETTSSSSVASP